MSGYVFQAIFLTYFPTQYSSFQRRLRTQCTTERKKNENTITQRLFLQQHQNLFIKPRENTSDPPLQHLHLETTLQFNRQRRMDRTHSSVLAGIRALCRKPHLQRQPFRHQGCPVWHTTCLFP